MQLMALTRYDTRLMMMTRVFWRNILIAVVAIVGIVLVINDTTACDVVRRVLLAYCRDTN